MRLNHKTFGQGPPVVILHGLFGMLDNWQTFAKKLAIDYTVYVLDLRNHGKSPHAQEMTYSIMAEDVARFMEREWIHKAHVVGHSMGGKVAMKLAEEDEDLIEKLAIIDIVPKPYAGGHAHIIRALKELPVSTLDSRQQAQAILQSKLDDLSTVLFLMKSLRRSKKGGFEWKFNLQDISASYESILSWSDFTSSIDLPTLFIRGGKSNYIKMEDYPLIEDHFSNAFIQTIEKANHWVHVDAPDELFQLLINFFEAEA